VILVYEVDETATVSSDKPGSAKKDASSSAPTFNMSALIEALKRRINPSGTKEIVIRPFGEKQVEIVIPDVGEVEVARIKRQLSTAGVLQFRIVANRRDHKDVVDLAEEMARDPLLKRSKIIYDDERTPVGLWARVARENNTVRGVRPFKTPVLGDVIRDASTGDLLQIPADRRFDENYRLEDYLQEQGIKEIDVLVWTHDGYDVNGSHLGAVSSSFDEQLVPCVNFNMRGAGAALFGGLTSSNVPEGEFYRRLAILLDNDIISAPRLLSAISDRDALLAISPRKRWISWSISCAPAASRSC